MVAFLSKHGGGLCGSDTHVFVLGSGDLCRCAAMRSEFCDQRVDWVCFDVSQCLFHIGEYYKSRHHLFLLDPNPVLLMIMSVISALAALIGVFYKCDEALIVWEMMIGCHGLSWIIAPNHRPAHLWIIGVAVYSLCVIDIWRRSGTDYINDD